MDFHLESLRFPLIKASGLMVTSAQYYINQPKQPADTNNIMETTPNEIQNGSYKFIVLPGNNGEIVKKLLLARNWAQASDSELPNLRWHPVDNNFRYEKLNTSFQKMMFNHFQFHKELSIKSGLVRNLRIYYERKQLNVFDMTPLTFIVNLDSRSYEQDLSKFTQFFVKNQPTSLKSFEENNFINERGIQIQSRSNKQTQLQQQSLYNYCKPYMHKSYVNGGSYLWMLKPTGLNRGRGIYVFNNLKRLEELLNQYYDGFVENEVGEVVRMTQSAIIDKIKPARKNTDIFIKWNAFVIQKYIERPLLIYGRKFDIRMWALVTQRLELYIFKEGYLRTSCERYSLDEDKIDDTYIHLTNNAIQKNSTNYGQFEAGNQLSFNEFQKYLDLFSNGVNFYSRMLPKIKDLITQSMASVKTKLNRYEVKNCFEIFGYDFIIDEFYNVWLIEVNTNPCIELSSPILCQLIPRMINDAFNLTIDLIFPPKNTVTTFKKSPEQFQKTQPEESVEQIIKTQENQQPESTPDIVDIKIRKRDGSVSRRKKEPKLSNEEKFKHQNYNFCNDYDAISSYAMNTKLQYNAEAETYLRNILSRSKLEKSQENKIIQHEEKDIIIEEPKIEYIETKKCLTIEEILCEYRKSYPVIGYSHEENMWEFQISLGQTYLPLRKRG